MFDAVFVFDIIGLAFLSAFCQRLSYLSSSTDSHGYSLTLIISILVQKQYQLSHLDMAHSDDLDFMQGPYSVPRSSPLEIVVDENVPIQENW